MNADWTYALGCCREFIAFQKRLLSIWLSENPASRDLDLLLDFPKRTTFCIDESTWNAVRHGTGVRFLRNDGLEVDVPFGVTSPYEFDENRVYDYHLSTVRIGSTDAPVGDRSAWRSTITALLRCNLLIAHVDGLGRRVLRLAEPNIVNGPGDALH